MYMRLFLSLLLHRYNFKLDLVNCGSMDGKSVAFKLLDIAVSAYNDDDKSASVMDRVNAFIKVSSSRVSLCGLAPHTNLSYRYFKVRNPIAVTPVTINLFFRFYTDILYFK